MIRAFIQARMTSARFPGKVLAPLRGEPVIASVVRAVAGVRPLESIVVATSTERSDDPLVAYLESRGVTVFRGPLRNVFERFRVCLRQFPCDWILRVNADSPLWCPQVGAALIERAAAQDCDLVTTIFPRTFPKGCNAELIRSDTFVGIDRGELSADDQEHVTQVYYRSADRFRIVNVESGDRSLAGASLTVDTVDDVRRLEQATEPERVMRAWGRAGAAGSQ